MKSLLASLASLLLLCSLTACGAESDNTTGKPGASPAASSGGAMSAPQPAATAGTAEPSDQDIEEAIDLFDQLSSLSEEGFNPAWTGDLDGMEERRVIRVLTVYSIGRYYLDGVEQRGLTYEMFKTFEKFINERLDRGHLKVHVVFVPVPRDKLLPALLQGKGDIVAASLSITEERSGQVAFTNPVSKPVSEILVTGPAAPEVGSIDDLSGETLYVRQSSSYRESLERLNQTFDEQGLAKVKIEFLPEMLEDDDIIEMVNAGMLPWAIVDDYKTQLWEGVFNDLVVREDIVFRVGGRIAWAIRPNSPKLQKTLNDFIRTHKEGTLFGNILVNRYIRDFDWAANALADQDYQRLLQLVDIFRNYGEQYGVDYLMSAAQGYQESRLRQEARSAAGAIGIMQLLPSTAADPNVGIADITTAENNIHAGVKYLQFLRDRYFSDPGIDQLNGTLLALAAYNAGPSRMINLRNEADKAGYDPNVWFDNVEVIAARRIGRETVQYVANIYKYYLAYTMVLEQRLRHEAARRAAGIGSEN